MYNQPEELIATGNYTSPLQKKGCIRVAITYRVILINSTAKIIRIPGYKAEASYYYKGNMVYNVKGALKA